MYASLCVSIYISGFDLCVGKIPWRRPWQPTPVFSHGESPWTEEPGGLQAPWGPKEPSRTQQLSLASVSLNRFAVHLEPTQLCKPSTLQFEEETFFAGWPCNIF